MFNSHHDSIITTAILSMSCHVSMCYVYEPISHSILRSGVDVKSLTGHEKHIYIYISTDMRYHLHRTRINLNIWKFPISPRIPHVHHPSHETIPFVIWKKHGDLGMFLPLQNPIYPLVMTNIAVENHHV